MAEIRAQRRLAAILAADVVGYSRLMEHDEAGTLAALKVRRRDVLAPLVAQHHGRVVKLMGDGVLVEFASAVDAVQCAVELQKGFTGANQDVAEAHRIVLRIGINLGDVIVEGSDLYGDGVNVAARLEGLAEPGGIYVSASVYDQVKRKLSSGFDELGPHKVKNIAEPVQVYRVLMGERQAAQSTAQTHTKPSIAVLPFANMSGDAEQQYFSDGITEDIITELSRFRSLFVIARNSSFQYRDKAVDVRRVGRELGVGYVVEGSVRKMGDKVRITTQLIDAQSANHLWSERYDRGLDDLFAVQDEVTRTIVATLTGRVEDAEIRSASAKPTDNPHAHDCLLRGIEHFRGYGADDNRRARELFETAISLDPRFALAHAYHAMALLAEHSYESAPTEISDKALASALAAVRLEPSEGRCHASLGLVYSCRKEYDLAIQHLERGTVLNPNDANGFAQLGATLATCGRAVEAIALISQAMRLNPFHPEWYWFSLATAFYAARRYGEALDANRKIAYATRAWNRARVAACLAQLGRLDEARAETAEVLRLKPDFSILAEMPHYEEPADAEHVLGGMRKAGLPE